MLAAACGQVGFAFELLDLKSSIGVEARGHRKQVAGDTGKWLYGAMLMPLKSSEKFSLPQQIYKRRVTHVLTSWMARASCGQYAACTIQRRSDVGRCVLPVYDKGCRNRHECSMGFSRSEGVSLLTKSRGPNSRFLGVCQWKPLNAIKKQFTMPACCNRDRRDPRTLSKSG